MSIIAYKITRLSIVPFSTQAGTFDEMTRGLPYGFYTTFSTLAGGTKVLGLSAHLRRLYHPAAETGLNPAVNEAALRAQVASLVKINLPDESRVRLILTKHDGAIYIGIQSFSPLPEAVYRDGVQVISANIARGAPRVKGTDFITKSVEQRKLVQGAIFEVLLTHHGKILEGMTSNFYAIKERTLITARSEILLGVTRRAVLRLARGQGMSIEYRAPVLSQRFDESFLTSSSRGIVPIISINQNPVGQGQVGDWTKKLMRAYANYIESRCEPI